MPDVIRSATTRTATDPSLRIPRPPSAPPGRGVDGGEVPHCIDSQRRGPVRMRLYDAGRMATGTPDLSCTRCEAPIPAGARFCMNCGEPVAPATDTDRERQAS